MNREELKNLIRGIIVTTPTPFDDDYRLDLVRTTEIHSMVVGAGAWPYGHAAQGHGRWR